MSELLASINKDPRRAVYRMVAATAIFLALTGCRSASEVNAMPGFNHPPRGDYFLDSSDPYYKNLDGVLSATNNPEIVKNIERLRQTPIAEWLNDRNASVLVAENINQSRSDATVPVFVVYNIPKRDLGGEAAGGADSVEHYRDWIGGVSNAIGEAPSIVILEPDALPDLPDMALESDCRQRVSMLHDALKTFRDKNKNTAVYLDVGHSRWLSAKTVADLIRQVDPDVELVGGISVNVSYQASEEASMNYANDISTLLGYRLRVMIDNSMNGAPSTDMIIKWCNPENEHIGNTDRTYSAGFVETAYIKTPGESDGNCGTSNMRAGEFDRQLLIRQVS